jgi:metal-dependent HD superfamily phosphatase/phosphodiesterase
LHSYWLQGLRVLRDAGIDPEVVVSGVDETADDGLDTAALVAVLADIGVAITDLWRKTPATSRTGRGPDSDAPA